MKPDIQPLGGAVTLNEVLQALLKNGIVDSYTKVSDGVTWRITKYADGTLRMRTVGVKTVLINYTASGSLAYGSYILEFPEESITAAQINCTVVENSDSTFWGTRTTQSNLTRADLLFVKGSARTSLRTNHSIEIIGTWK